MNPKLNQPVWLDNPGMHSFVYIDNISQLYKFETYIKKIKSKT